MELQFTIRPAAVRDAQDINEIRRMPGVMEHILGVPSEPLSGTEAFLENLGPNSHQMVAVTEAEGKEKVIGVASLDVGSRPRTRHRGTIGIMVHKKYHGMGVGTALMETLLDIADNWLMLVRVDLGVFTENTRAIAFYERLGFTAEGVCRKAAIRDGEYADELIMVRFRE